jgi:hypothetical protein
MIDFPVTYGFSPTTPVIGPNGKLISSTWSGMFQPIPTPNPTVVLTNTLLAAGVLPPSPAGLYATGTNQDGTANTVQGSCNAWSSSAPTSTGSLGSIAQVNLRWVYNPPVLSFTCNNNGPYVCLCISNTARPTLNPTKNPTPKPV